jgi:ABC-2 type transport system permease protein
MAFRGNFIAKVVVELLWLGLLLIFYQTVFARTSMIAGWSEMEYLFYVGVHFTLAGILETFFLSNCAAFADLVRSGDLDFYLLKPIDEQFLITCRDIDWTTAPNVVLGVVLMVVALVQMGWTFDPARLVLFLVLMGCGIGLAYSFLVMLTSMSVWMVRNQSLYELWWLFTTLMRYPRDIFVGTWAAPLGWFFTFVLPVMVVVNVPAQTLVKVFEPGLVLFTVVVTGVAVVLSRWVFRRALRTYRSASS